MVVFLIGGESRLMEEPHIRRFLKNIILTMTVTASERFLRVQIQMLLFLLAHRIRITVGKMPEKKRYNFLQI